MAPDHVAEIALIEMSRLQRAALEIKESTMSELLLNAFRFHFRNATAGYVNANCAKIGAAKWAIARARDDVAAGKTRYPRDHVAAVTWQAEPKAHDAIGTWANPFPRKSERLAFVQDIDGAGLRHVGNVEADCGGRNGFWSRRDSCGWYTDNAGDVFKDGTGLCWGVVYQLPARDGKARFVAGYIFGGCSDDLPAIDFGTIYESESGRGDYYNSVQDHDDARDAARAADSMAQRAAEAEREYQAAWQAGSQFAERAETIAAERKAALALLAERRRAATAGKGEAFQAICGAPFATRWSRCSSPSMKREPSAKS